MMRKRRTVAAALLLGVLVVGGLAIWATEGGPAVPAEPSDEELIRMVDPAANTDYTVLRARLEPEQKIFFTGQPIMVQFQLINTSDKPVLVKVPFQAAPADDKLTVRHLAAGLSLEHVFSRKPLAEGAPGRRALVINPYNDPIREIDDDVVYRAAGPIEPIVIRPRGTVGRRVDLAQHYPSLNQPGRFIIQWRPYSDALRSLATEIRIMTQERAVIETSMGDIRLEFFPDKAPNHVENFLDLARRGFYDGTLFHRVIDGFMVQAGDPLTADASRRDEWGTGRGPRTLKQEFNDTAFNQGILGAARGPDVNSASCQFFIVTGEAGHLTGQYTAFGRVCDADSLRVAQAISKVPRDQRDRPRQNVLIKKVRVEPIRPATQPATQPD